MTGIFADYPKADIDSLTGGVYAFLRRMTSQNLRISGFSPFPEEIFRIISGNPRQFNCRVVHRKMKADDLMNNFRENCVRDLKRLFHLLYTLTYFVSLVPLKLYDILHGTEFSGIDNSEDKEGRYTYYPSPVFSFPRLRRYIRRNMQNGRGRSVLDIGCGKGFVLLFFSGLSFDKVAGIEYDEKLCRIARRNLRKTSGKIKVYRADAADFPLYENYDTFYLYNPFDEKILEKCIDLILASLKKCPRKLTVFYCNPVYGDVLKKKGFEEAAHFYYKTTIFILYGEQ